MVILYYMTRPIKQPTTKMLEYIKTHCKYDPNTGEITCDTKHKIGSRKTGETIDAVVIIFFIHIAEYNMLASGRYYAHQIAWYLTHNEWPKLYIDHKDGNPTNNKFNNLRLATAAQNMYNQRKTNRKTSSQYKGVVYRTDTKMHPWRAHIMFKGKQISLGQYGTELEAAEAYDKKALELFGEFASLNIKSK